MKIKKFSEIGMEVEYMLVKMEAEIPHFSIDTHIDLQRRKLF